MSLPYRNDRQPKFVFGLLETPASASTNERLCDYGSSTSSIGHGYARQSSSTGPYRSGSSSSVPRPPHNIHTPVTGTSSAHSRTPGSRSTPYCSSTTPSTGHRSSVIVAIVEGRGSSSGVIGMSAIDLRRPVLTLFQFTDNQAFVKVLTKLHILNPVEVIMPNTACQTVLYKLLVESCQNANITTVQRKYFNENNGFQMIKHLCLSDYNTVEMEVRDKYYCLATTAALLKYVEYIQVAIYAHNSLKIEFKGSDQTAMIDLSTAANLELTLNARDVRSPHSLFGVLNYTKTPMGCALLVSNIQQPPCDLGTINSRLDVVAELTQNSNTFFSIQTVVSQFPDIDDLMARCVSIPKQETVSTAESKINNIIHLKHSIDLVAPLKDALRDGQSSLLKACYTSLEDHRFQELQEKINTVIMEETQVQKGALNMRMQNCFAVKPNINGLLDVARRTYSEIVDDIADLIKSLAEEYSLPLRTSYNSSRGFFIQLSCKGKETYSKDSLPGIFLKVSKNQSTLACTTSDLIESRSLFKRYIL